jgi:hypothetical protein
VVIVTGGLAVSLVNVSGSCGRLSEVALDQAKLAGSFFVDQKFVRLRADAIGRKSTVCPKVGWIQAAAAGERKPLISVTSGR